MSAQQRTSFRIFCNPFHVLLQKQKTNMAKSGRPGYKSARREQKKERRQPQPVGAESKSVQQLLGELFPDKKYLESLLREYCKCRLNIHLTIFFVTLSLNHSTLISAIINCMQIMAILKPTRKCAIWHRMRSTTWTQEQV